MQMNEFGLPGHVFREIKRVLHSFPQIECAKVFGSRAKGTHKRYSDIDIAIYAAPNDTLAQTVREALDDLDTIYTFDVLHYEQTENLEIKAHIDSVGVEIAE